jgi:hypothetical protein
MPRFVILCHNTPRGCHFDFMLEEEGTLKTWALPQPPQLGLEIEAQPLADHRLSYLDYEGPISGGRGSVTRWDAGTFSTKYRTETEWAILLAGKQFCGMVIISDTKGRTTIHFQNTAREEEIRNRMPSG